MVAARNRAAVRARRLPDEARDITLAPVKAGETAHVTVRGLSLEGEAVADCAGRELLVSGIFPGESAEVRVTALSRHHARGHAELVQLTAPHPARRTAPCLEHVARGGRCTGCALMELSEQAQREAKAQMLRERFALSVERVEPAPSDLGYRWSAKRVAFGRHVKLGSFARESHRPADMARCLVDHPRLVSAFAEITRQANALGIEAFDERTGRGELRAVWAKTDGERVIATLVVSEQGKVLEELAPALSFTGVLVSVHAGRGNDLRGALPTLVKGVSELETPLLDQTLEVGALGFLQPNPRVAAQCYTALTEAAHGKLALDLYAGSGVTTRALRRRFDEVVPCESYAESAKALGVVPETSEAFLARWNARDKRVPELVIANPPRKGLGPEVCASLLTLGAPELRIMSCGPEGLARDLKLLSSHYEVKSLRAFDTLPQTPHVELVAVLSRLPHHP